MRPSPATALLIVLLLTWVHPGLTQTNEDGEAVPPSFAELTYRILPEISCRQGETVVAATIRAQDPERRRYLLELTVQSEGVVGQDECLEVLGRGCILQTMRPPRLLSDHEIASLSSAIERILADLPQGVDPFCALWDACMLEEYTIVGQQFAVGPCGMPRLTFEQGEVLFGLLEGLRRGDLILENGDTNGDTERNLSDAVYLLTWLFLGGPDPVEVACQTAFDCSGQVVELENGDTNGDGERDLSDAVYLLNWLFVGGAEPLPICFCT